MHFVGLVNVKNLEAGGLGSLGRPQLEWLEKDLDRISSSTPVVVFAHIPLWTVYPDWGWGTQDSAQALTYLRRFGSVTVLNGHIHQTMQKVEGNITFHTAMSTAFPQPRPGTAAGPGPMKVPAAQLQALLGVTSVNYRGGQRTLGLVDTPLEAASSPATAAHDVVIDNFRFTPATLVVPAGARVTWINRDDAPHRVVSTDKKFASSPVLDTGDRYSLSLSNKGTYDYFCSLHPMMVGKIVAG